MRIPTSFSPALPDSELDFPTAGEADFPTARDEPRQASAADVLRSDMAAGRVPDGAVIRYTRCFRGNRTLYTYAAVHIGDQWYTTSKSEHTPAVFTHEAFMANLNEDTVVSVEVASSYTAVSAPKPPWSSPEPSRAGHSDGERTRPHGRTPPC